MDVALLRNVRTALEPGIVHLGIGAFARAHLAVATDAAIDATGDRRWGIVGVSLRSADTRDALAPQDGLYTVSVREADGADGVRESLRVVGCLQRLLVAPEEPGAVLDAIASPQARIVSLTITEKGYGLDAATRQPRLDTPEHAHDLHATDAPRSAAGFIVHGLARRRARGLGGLTLMSLDNLASNGHALRGLVLAFAEAVDPALARWIDTTCTFPCSMVDRIVPRTTDADRDRIAHALGGVRDAWPVVTETFFDWAIEDRFAAGRPEWAYQPGARFVSDAAPWETLKLRMVNGAHSTIAYLAVAAGWATVDEAIAQPALRAFVDTLMRDEIEPTLTGLDGSFDIAAYRTQLLARFANPALAHRTMQIAMDGSQKLPARLLGTVRDRLARGQPVDRLAVSIAAWLTHLRGHDDAGHPYTVDDPLAPDLAALAQRLRDAGTPDARAGVALRFKPVFGDLADAPMLRSALARALESMDRGVVAMLAGRNGP